MNIFKDLSRSSRRKETSIIDTADTFSSGADFGRSKTDAPREEFPPSEAVAHGPDDAHEAPFGGFGRSSRAGWPQPSFHGPERPFRNLHYPDHEGIQAAIAPYFDGDFYGVSYPDVAQSGMPPIKHYVLYGWREQRDPSPAFSTARYLLLNPDVAERGINPFWHHIVLGARGGRTQTTTTARALQEHDHRPVDRTGRGSGDRRTEQGDPESPIFESGPGRIHHHAPDRGAAAGALDPRRYHDAVASGQNRGRRSDISFQRAVLRGLKAPDVSSAEHEHAGAVSILEPHALAAILRERLPAAGLALSFSHDAYTRAVGGTQILIADEQARFATQGLLYLHLAPVLPALHLKRDLDGSNPLSATLDGEAVGVIDARVLVVALRSLEHELPSRRLLICHCVLGHDPADIRLAHDSLRPQQSVFWVHDYSSICEGYNLLRNDVEYCGAPPADSQACRICIYGPRRVAHLQAIRALFTNIPFHVVAPSEAALAVWRSRADLPFRSLSMHPHAEVAATARRRSTTGSALHGTPKHPLRIGFAGHPASHKGWPSFLSLVREHGSDAAYRFFHFAADPSPAHGLPIETIRVRVTSNDRDAMRAALEARSIDLVLALSPWPETFSFVTYEALGAGADILALRDSGNVADEVLRSGRGVVFDTLHDLREFMTSGLVIEYVRLCFRTGNMAGPLKNRGGTATLGLIGEL